MIINNWSGGGAAIAFDKSLRSLLDQLTSRERESFRSGVKTISLEKYEQQDIVHRLRCEPQAQVTELSSYIAFFLQKPWRQGHSGQRNFC